MAVEKLKSHFGCGICTDRNKWIWKVQNSLYTENRTGLHGTLMVQRSSLSRDLRSDFARQNWGWTGRRGKLVIWNQEYRFDLENPSKSISVGILKIADFRLDFERPLLRVTGTNRTRDLSTVPDRTYAGYVTQHMLPHPVFGNICTSYSCLRTLTSFNLWDFWPFIMNDLLFGIHVLYWMKF